jgi:hypothetical protein
MSRPSVRLRPLAVAALATVTVVVSTARPIVAAAEVAPPTLEGVVAEGQGKPFLGSTAFDLAQVAYQETEFFISGTASAFTSAVPLTKDGKWTVTPGATAAYKTRLLVRRPADPGKFNGTVVVEWLNVSGGVDAAPDWTNAHTELIRDGFAWVGVSAQYTGVEGGGALLPIVDLPLKKADPVRYESLVHPGDGFSYDIFSQAGRVIRHPTGTNPLGDLMVKKMIAAGESQSAFRLVTYINAIHPLGRIYDGFFVHSRGVGGPVGAPLSQAPQPRIDVPVPTLIRSHLDVPVLILETETDLIVLGFLGARQRDTRRLRLWEVAGTAHADTYQYVNGGADLGTSPAAADIVITTTPVPGLIVCDRAINSGPQHFVLNAAFAALNRWVRTGRPPARAPRLTVTGSPPAIARDVHGNALGGIRTPQVDVPIATYTGQQASSSIVCLISGSTTLFDAPTLASLYPDHDAYVSKFNQATKRAVRAGFILKRDAQLLKEWAAGSDIGR